MLHRNSNLIASILGILKAGCAYIPIDLEYPKDRINYIYENSQADYIISDEDKENSLNIQELLKEANTERKTILNMAIGEPTFLEYKFCLYKPLEKLKTSTDGMLKKELQSKIIQN